MKVSVVIVNFNTAGYLEACVKSLYETEQSVEKEIIIVDNNSSDNSREVISTLSKKFSELKYIFLESNKGFAFANNRGVEISSGEYVLILNPDVVFTQSILDELIIKLQDKSIGAIGVKLIGEDGKFQKRYYQKHPSLSQYVFLYSILSKPFYNSGKINKKILEAGINPETEEYIEVKQIPGAFIFLRKEIYKEFGGFNEKYFLFFEDVDLSFRIQKKYKLILSGKKVTHKGASSMYSDSDTKIYGLFIISFLKFFRFNYSSAKYIFIKVIIYFNSIAKIILENLKRIFGKGNKEIIEVHRYIMKNLNN